MKKIYISIVLLTLIINSCFLFAQPSYDWSYNIGSSTKDAGFSVGIDNANNVYTYGLFSGNVDINPGAGTKILNSTGSRDIFLMKTDAGGNFLFGFEIPCDTELCSKMVIDKLNAELIVCGNFQGTPDMNPDLGLTNISSINGSCFIVKYSSSGQLIWVKQIGNQDFEGLEITAITIDDSSNIIICGDFKDTVDMDPSNAKKLLYPDSNKNIFVAKYNNSGSLAWSNAFYARGNIKVNAVTTDRKSNIVLTGFFTDSVDFDNSENEFFLNSLNEKEDIFSCKLDNQGKFLWAKSFGGSESDMSYSVDIDNCQNIYLCGSFQDTLKYQSPTNETIYADSLKDAIVIKLNGEGQTKWIRNFSGKGTEEGKIIKVNLSGDIFICGEFEKEMKFGVNQSDSIKSEGEKDIFIFKMNALGSIICSGQIGGISNDSIAEMQINNRDEIFLSGSFSDSCDFNPGANKNYLSSNGEYDSFTCKLLPGSCCVAATPVSTADANPKEICSGESSTLIATPQTTESCPHLVWYAEVCGLNFQSDYDTISAAPTITTNYFVRHEGPCDTSECLAVNIEVYPKPVAYFEYQLSMNCDGPLFKFSNKSVFADTYEWKFSDGTKSMLKNPPDHQFFYNSEVNIQLIAKNEFGCSDTLSITNKYSLLEDYYKLSIPNIFTPNGDGINDEFRINFQGDFSDCYTIKIFDRWGTVVFSSNNPAFTWDGESNSGGKASQGVYFYVMEIAGKKLRGFISLNE
jgi:gliding motility-associated-like protein